MTTSTDQIFSDRIMDVPRSFIREILKVALDESVISFAGGLPNRKFFPVEALKEAAVKVFDKHGADVLQYGGSEGHRGLRQYISEHYRRKSGLDIPVDNILVTSGSQQGLDLLGKVLLNDGDGVVIEEPGYLGAIQAFSLYKPTFAPVPVSQHGMDLEKLTAAIRTTPRLKLMYTVPNFQNPSGVTYPENNRRDLAGMIEGSNMLIVEDDPYRELRFEGVDQPSFMSLLPGNTVSLGSFSKTLVPGLRLGWLAAGDKLMRKLVTAKQATDLHTSHFTQCVVWRYLLDHDFREHIDVIRRNYGSQCRAMRDAISRHWPAEVTHTRPEGGMFLWAELPGRLAALDLFDLAVKDKVVFVPGDPFYVRGDRHNTLRLNFSCADLNTIDIGVRKLGKVIAELMAMKAEPAWRPASK